MTGMAKRALATVLGAGLVAGGVTVAPASAQDLKQLHQGDGIGIRNPDGTWDGSCTVAYVDAERHLAYTAAHCFESLDQTAYLYNGRDIVGVPVHSAGGWVNADDWAVIDFSERADEFDVDNPYASEVASVSNLAQGDRVCTYGNKTKKLSCGTVRDVQFSNEATSGRMGFNIDNGETTAVGDSGAAVWTEDGKFVGVLTGSSGTFPGYKIVSLPPRLNGKLFSGSEIVVTEAPAPVTTTRTQNVTTTRTVTPAPVTTTQTVTSTPKAATVTETATPAATTVTSAPVTKTTTVTTTAPGHLATVTSVRDGAMTTVTNTEKVTAPAVTVTKDRTVQAAPVTETETQPAVTVTHERDIPGDTVTETVVSTPAPVTVTSEREVVVTKPAETVTATVTREAQPVTATVTKTQAPVTVTNQVDKPAPVTVTETVAEEFDRNPASEVSEPAARPETEQTSSVGHILAIVFGVLAALGLGAAGGAFAVQSGALRLPF
mgnify:CR=1 FL=1